jgi:hypothetical protein
MSRSSKFGRLRRRLVLDAQACAVVFMKVSSHGFNGGCMPYQPKQDSPQPHHAGVVAALPPRLHEFEGCPRHQAWLACAKDGSFHVS